MVHFSEFNFNSPSMDINSWIPKSERFGMVSTPIGMHSDCINLWTPNNSRKYPPIVSIVICTYGRQDSLNDTLESLERQTCRQFEIILLSKKGHLSSLRQKGLERAHGLFTAFIDDDVYCSPNWLQSINEVFKERKIVGVTGPTTIENTYKNNRDIFKYNLFKKIYDFLFLGIDKNRPSFLSIYGTPSTASNEANINYSGHADYLEACNMIVRTKEAIEIGGFDLAYKKTSEWCEVDLALRLRTKGLLVFDPRVALFHRPSKSGIYTSRLSTKHRWENFMYFQKKFEGKFIKKCFKTNLYRSWFWIYLKMKNMRII